MSRNSRPEIAPFPKRVRSGLLRRTDPGVYKSRSEYLSLVGNLHSKREKNLAFRVEPACSAGFDTVYRQRGKARLSRQFSLAHHERFAISLDVVARHRPPPCQSNA